ncbi:hypothetical protein NKW53_12935 [Acetobacter orientalis]|uniref:hypothetical protein n=1 Tax=Acetobacter TaxID=434 RepID=UPI0020A1E7FE|nr:hypothetical protein [Acetobacter orientalis]MCP1216968.1 hypothetical protein [Acetobacter orientalis]MCP1219872.1 hypothetical protein [Acetobacter orientalis]
MPEALALDAAFIGSAYAPAPHSNESDVETNRKFMRLTNMLFHPIAIIIPVKEH